ncbi:MAG: MlaD family protein [Nitrospirota bacterium]|nr:MlaD family protein [Nitrospirota bacterium]
MANDSPDFVIPEAVALPQRRWWLSPVWLIPLVAMLVGAGLAVKAIYDRGPTITITFKTAEGLEAGKTKIKYKNVDVGVVKQIALSADRSRVVVTAQLVKQAAPYLVEDTRFWVVSARIVVGEVTGLGTLFSGAYIGMDVGKSSKRQDQFTGLEVGPVIAEDLPGRQFVLRTDDPGSLDLRSPLFFRRVRVGQVVAKDLDQDGKGVTMKIFVEAPYDQYVTIDTRFWQASGIEVALDATGVRVETQSLASIVLGGIAFQTRPDAPISAPAAADTVFTLFRDRALAMKLPDTNVRPWVFVFDESVRGLEAGAPVEFRGLSLGEVTRVGAQYDPARKNFQMRVEVLLSPDRLRARLKEIRPEMENRKAMLDGLVEHGFRAQLRTGNLLTGQLYITLDFFPTAAPAKIDWTTDPPEMPTVSGELQELQVTLNSIMKKLDKVPFEEISREMRQTLRMLKSTVQTTEGLVQRLDKDVTPAALATLEDVRRTLHSAEHTFESDAPLQQDMREALHEIARAAQALRMLAEYLEHHPEAVIRGKKEEKP